MKIIGVNGFGRIGRCFTRIVLERDDLNVAVVNDLADIKTLAHLFKYDSIHGQLKHAFKIEGNTLVFDNGKKIVFLAERDPKNIKWSDYHVETVVECTGLFLDRDSAGQHLIGGAKKVVLSAPPKGSDIKTVVIGINDDTISNDDPIVSNASCTTNNIAPLFYVMKDLGDIESAFVTTVHSFTSDQRLHDAPHKDLRRARAATQSIVPTSTGAAKAIGAIFPEFKGIIGGSAVRVPVSDGSLSDITITMKNPLTVEAINSAMLKASEGKLKGVLAYTDEELVSTDIVGNSNSCLFDSGLTSVIGNMVKIVGWYDNEWGYSSRLADLTAKF